MSYDNLLPLHMFFYSLVLVFVGRIRWTKYSQRYLHFYHSKFLSEH